MSKAGGVSSLRVTLISPGFTNFEISRIRALLYARWLD